MSDRLQEAASGRTEPTKGLGAWIAGRARRREYWAWVAPLVAVGIALEVASVPGANLIVGLPLLFIWIRRLHDMGRSGWFAPLINVANNAFSFVVILALGAEAGAIVASLVYMALLVAMGAVPGQRTPNRYGPPPGPPSKLAETFS